MQVKACSRVQQRYCNYSYIVVLIHDYYQRVLSVAGVADAIHIATYYIGNILIEAQDRLPQTSHSVYRPGNARRPMHSGSSYVPSYSPYGPPPPPPHHPPQQLQTQQIYIPNDLVGCIIGKGGSKINEIRQMSASQIKIMEPGAVGVGVNGAPAPSGGEGERLVVITGQPANIQMAVQLLYHVRPWCFPSVNLLIRETPPAVGTGEAEATSCAAATVPVKLPSCPSFWLSCSSTLSRYMGFILAVFLYSYIHMHSSMPLLDVIR